MKKVFKKAYRKTILFISVLLSAMMIASLVPASLTSVYAANVPHYPAFSDDPYSNQLVRYEINDQCKGYYMTPKEAGKYRTFIMIHGGGGVAGERTRLWSPINMWVKEGYFPPMVVVIPEVLDYTGTAGLDIDDFQMFIYKGHTQRFNTLLNKVIDGSLTSQIDTGKPLYISGFSMGGLAAVYAGDEYNTKVNNVGGLSPSSSFYLGDGNWGFRNFATDIHFSTDSDALVYLSCGLGENAGFSETIDRYETGIRVNNGNNLVVKNKCPASWGGHYWDLEQKEIFMYLYYNIYGELPSQSLVESATSGISTKTPSIVYEEETHSGAYEEPEGPEKPPKQLVPEDVKGYTFNSTTFTYDGENHMISVTPASNATPDVDISYTLGGTPFTGAVEPGSYPITATITKEGYNELVLTATLKINMPHNPDETGYVIYGMDLSNMAKSVGTQPYTGTSGVEGVGDWADATTLVIRSKDGVAIDKGTFTNANGSETEYISLENTNADWTTNTIGFNFSNKELEENDNTISFWVDPERYTGKNTEILQYYVEYNGGTASFDLSINTEGNWNAQNNSTDTTADAYSVSGGWKHVVITNPKCSGGAKTMDVYINGQLKDTVTLNIPDNAAITNATVSLAARNQGDGFKYRVLKSAKYGNIEVRKGVMEAQDIQDLYEEQLPLFTEGTSTLENITGYTFENATVEYDGASHNITVTAGENATEGVDVAYTVNGAAFSGATEVGTYNVTATLTKAGYNKLVLTATLTIEPKAAQTVDDGDILFELDLSDLTPVSLQDPSGIVNAGKSQTAQIKAHSSDKVTFTTDFLYNKDDLSYSKKVLRITQNDPAGVTSSAFEIKDPAFEEQDITLSFWTNLDPISKQTPANSYYPVVQYNAMRNDRTFKNTADGTDSRARLWQASLETDPDSGYLWSNNWSQDTFEVGTDKQWHHVVMTIPKFTGGAKSVKVYVDGEEKLTETVNLGGKTLRDSWISFGSTETGAYIPGDISLSDVKVYAGAMSAEGVTNLYDSEKGFYDDMLYNRITVSKDGAVINKLTDLNDGDTITISCNENSKDGLRIFAACFNAEGTMLTAKTAVTNGEGELMLDIPAGFGNVKVYTWNTSKLSSLQKVFTLYK